MESIIFLGLLESMESELNLENSSLISFGTPGWLFSHVENCVKYNEELCILVVLHLWAKVIYDMVKEAR